MNPQSVLCTACHVAVPVGAFCANCGGPLQQPLSTGAPQVAAVVPAQAAPVMPHPPAGFVPPQPSPLRAPQAGGGSAGLDVSQTAGSFTATFPADGATLTSGSGSPTWRTRFADASPFTRSVLVLALVILAGGGAVAFLRSEKHTLTGSLQLSDSSSFSNLSPGDNCQGADGYDDIQSGAQIVVTDQSGKTLQTGALGSGIYDGMTCEFEIRIASLPKASFYRIQIGNQQRGTMQYSLTDMKANDWQVSLTLGDA